MAMIDELATRASRVTYIAESLKATIKVAASLEFNCKTSDPIVQDGCVGMKYRPARTLSLTALFRRADARDLCLTVTSDPTGPIGKS